MQEQKTPLVISIKDGKITADLPKLFEILSASCLDSTTNVEENPTEGPEFKMVDHKSLQPHKFLIVTVIGPPSSGKSFLINWVARYLAANGEQGWMKRSSASSAPLEGFDWNPYPEDELDIEENHSCGVRILRDVATICQNDCDGTGVGLHKAARVVLLDIDQRNRQNKEFQRSYTALTASCVLISTVAIYVDVDTQKGLFDPRVVLGILERAVPDLSTGKRKPEIISMVNRHFGQHPASCSTELKTFCSRYEIPFAQLELPTLIKGKRPGQFQGALDHMDINHLKLAMLRMIAVDGLLGKKSQTIPEMFEMIRNVLDRINVLIKPDVWEELLLGPPPPLPAQPAPDQIYNRSIQGGQNPIPQFRQNRKAAGAENIHVGVSNETNLNGHGADNATNQYRHHHTATSIRVEDTPLHMHTQLVQMSTPQQPYRESIMVKMSTPTVVAPASVPPSKITTRKPIAQDPELCKSGSAAAQDSGSRLTEQKKTAPPGPLPSKTTIFRTEGDVKGYLDQYCYVEFTHFLLEPKFLKPFMVSSMVRMEVAQHLGELIVMEHFQGHQEDLQKYASNSFSQIITVFLQGLAYLTEAIDKGRNIIDNEFDSEIYLANDADIDKLVARARKFSMDRFKPIPDKGHEKVFDLCWSAIADNTKLRNEKIRQHEREINSVAIRHVFGLYTEELRSAIGDALRGELNEADLVRIPKLNDVLVGDCLKVLVEIKDFRPETERAKAELRDKMIEFYHEKIGSRIAEITKRKLQEVEEKRKEEEKACQKQKQQKLAAEEQSKGTPGSSGPMSYANAAKHGAITREKVLDLGGAHATSSNFVNGEDYILVIHLGRGSTVKFVPVGKSPQNLTPIGIPACIAFVNGDFVIGENATTAPGAISSHEIHAGSETYRLHGEEMRYEQILGLFLAKGKQQMEVTFRVNINSCLLVIPAMCSSVDRQAMFDSASIAGFTKVKLVSEPTSVAYDYYCNNYLKSNATRSTDLAMVLYFGASGGKELALYGFSQSHWGQGLAVQMKGLSGSVFLPYFEKESFFSKVWNLWKSSSEYKKFAYDVFTNSHVTTSVERTKLIVAGDCDKMVNEALMDVDINTKGFEFTRHDYCESAISGAVLLAEQMLQGRQFKSLVTEKYAFPVKLKYSSGYDSSHKVFGRNADMESIEYMDIKNVKGSCILELFSEKPPTQLGTYQVYIERPNSLHFNYLVKLPVQLSPNGVLRVLARLKENGVGETKFHDLTLERLDELNLNPESMGKCKRFIMNSMRGSQEEQDKEKTKEELRDYLHYVKAMLDKYVSVNGDIRCRQFLEGEINKTNAIMQDAKSDLETLRQQLLTLRRIISKDQ